MPGLLQLLNVCFRFQSSWRVRRGVYCCVRCVGWRAVTRRNASQPRLCQMMETDTRIIWNGWVISRRDGWRSVDCHAMPCHAISELVCASHRALREPYCFPTVRTGTCFAVLRLALGRYVVRYTYMCLPCRVRNDDDTSNDNNENNN